MASDSKDFIHPETGYTSYQEPDGEHRSTGEDADDSAHVPDPAPPESEEALTASPSNGESEGAPEDEELIGMLEQLCETIDTAQNVLASQHEMASGTPNAAQTAAPDHYPPPSPPPPPSMPAKRSGVFSMLAASAGVLLGVGALAAFWMMWKSSPFPDAREPAKTQDRVTETIVSRNPFPDAVIPLAKPEIAAAPEPLAPEAPSPVRPAPEPPAPEAPAQVQPAPPIQLEASLAPVTAAEPPVTEPGTAAGQPPAAANPKEELEVAAIPVEKTPELPPLEAEKEKLFLERGRTLTETGDVASARLAYEYAALRGSMDAMFALGQTYDPEMLAAWSVVGIGPDMEEALKWYGAAAGLGHDRAGARKRELEQQTGAGAR